MNRLDCSSPATTCASLSTIFGVAPEEVERRCRALDLNAEDPHRSFIEALFGAPPSAEPIEVVYFHVSRAFPSRQTFDEGLLPLGAAIDGLWADLYHLVRDECAPKAWVEFREWVERGDVPYPAHDPSNEPFSGSRTKEEWIEAFKRNVGDADAQRARRLYQMISDYRERIKDPARWGPGGFLIREAALRPSAIAISCNSGHPLQIVEDIAAAYEARFSRADLLTEYLRATEPVLVKFYDVRPGWSSLEVAARYLCLSAQRREVYILDCFDGGGQPVPLSRVLGVE